MILGIGMDLVRTSRVADVIARRGDRALRRLYTAGEAEACRGRGRPMESFASRFAAKEAAFKAFGTGWGRGGAWTDAEVVSLPSGAPTLRLHGPLAALAEARGVRRVHLTLTHDGDTAAAVVVLEGGG